jgi:biotin operon repressor
MSEAKLSERAQKILTWLTSDFLSVRFLRQQTLADEFKCSRRTIGRALKELKEAGLLVDLNKRHANRCKLYELSSLRPQATGMAENNPETAWIATSATPPRNDMPTPHGEQQLKLYRTTFEAIFRDWPDWQKYYPQVTRKLAPELDPDQLFRQTFDGLYAIQGG